MYFPPEERSLGDILKKVQKGERVTLGEAVRMLESNDLLAIGYMANLLKEKAHGQKVYFIAPDCAKESNAHTAILSYGSGQTLQDIAQQLIKLRQEQDNNHVFTSFSAQLTPSDDLQGRPTGVEDLKVLAVARIILDNFSHIKVDWLILGAKLMQVALDFGVDEIDTQTQQELTSKDIVKIIKLAGKKPIQCDCGYNALGEVL